MPPQIIKSAYQVAGVGRQGNVSLFENPPDGKLTWIVATLAAPGEDTNQALDDPRLGSNMFTWAAHMQWLILGTSILTSIILLTWSVSVKKRTISDHKGLSLKLLTMKFLKKYVDMFGALKCFKSSNFGQGTAEGRFPSGP